MAQTTVPTFDQQDIQQNKTMAGLAFFYVLFFLPLVSCPNSAFGKWAANQGLVALILSVVLGLLWALLEGIPVIGTILVILFSLANFALTVFVIISAIAAFQGQAKPLPLVGGITLLK